MTIHFLLARQRSGTGALGSVLNAHSDISYLGELFHPNEISHNNNYFNFLLKKLESDPLRGLPAANETNYREFLAHIESLETKKHVFIDVKYSSTHHFNGYWHSPFDIPKLLQFCQKEKRKILHLKRQNFLKTFISGQLAEQNKVWHAKSDDNLKVTRITIKPVQLLNYLKSTAVQVNHFDNFLNHIPHVLTLEYEELFQPNGQLNKPVVEKISAFLNIDSLPFETINPAFVKQTSDNLADVIENYREVQSCLAGTDFSWMTSSTSAAPSAAPLKVTPPGSSAIVSDVNAWIASTNPKSIRPHSFLSNDLNDAISDETFMENSADMLKYLAANLPEAAKVVDYMCGDLEHKNDFDALNFDWVGLDNCHSSKPETDNPRIRYLDNAESPFEDRIFDMVWSSQALEHIEDIDLTFGDIARILKKDGIFAGKVSFLEPYHARSTYCYTPYGFSLLLEKYGIRLEKISPGVDGLTLLLKKLSAILSEEQDWSKIFGQQGILKQAITAKMLTSGFKKTEINALLLQICGHFRFIARKFE